MKNKEIEIKIRISKEKYLELKKLLDKTAKFKGEFTQQDIIFDYINESFIQKDGSIYKWLRLRKENDKNIMTFKNVYNTKGRQKDEFEFELSDGEQARKLLEGLGYEKLIEFTKTREKYIYKKHFEIVLDYIQELGYFMEIELLEIPENIDAEKALEEQAIELNLNLEDESVLGYAHILMIKRGITKVPDFAKRK